MALKVCVGLSANLCRKSRARFARLSHLGPLRAVICPRSHLCRLLHLRFCVLLSAAAGGVLLAVDRCQMRRILSSWDAHLAAPRAGGGAFLFGSGVFQGEAVAAPNCAPRTELRAVESDDSPPGATSRSRASGSSTVAPDPALAVSIHLPFVIGLLCDRPPGWIDSAWQVSATLVGLGSQSLCSAPGWAPKPQQRRDLPLAARVQPGSVWPAALAVAFLPP